MPRSPAWPAMATRPTACGHCAPRPGRCPRLRGAGWWRPPSRRSAGEAWTALLLIAAGLLSSWSDPKISAAAADLAAPAARLPGPAVDPGALATPVQAGGDLAGPFLVRLQQPPGQAHQRGKVGH